MHQIVCHLAIIILCSAFSGCSTIQELKGPSYDPSSYGVEALKGKIADPASSVVDAVAAAKALLNRKLTEKDGWDIAGLIKDDRDSEISIQLLRLIQIKEMSYLKDRLLEIGPELKNPESVAELSITLLPMLEMEERLDYATTQLWTSESAAVRARACRYLASEFPEHSEFAFIRALEKEANAVVASEICRALAKMGTLEAIAILDEISNKPERVFEEDNIFGSKVDATQVRIDAIQAHETIKSTFGE